MTTKSLLAVENLNNKALVESTDKCDICYYRLMLGDYCLLILPLATSTQEKSFRVHFHPQSNSIKKCNGQGYFDSKKNGNHLFFGQF